jgi:F0F1-type ATP synthase, subunit b
MQNLGLDWKVLIAQIVNFGLLLILLKKYLYKPLVKAIDDRNKKISGALDDSKKIEEKLKNIETKEVELLNLARQKARKERDEIVDIALKEKEKIVDEARVSAQREVEKGIDRLESAQKEAVKVLSDKYMDEVVTELYKRFTERTKKNNYPILKSLLK